MDSAQYYTMWMPSRTWMQEVSSTIPGVQQKFHCHIFWDLSFRRYNRNDCCWGVPVAQQRWRTCSTVVQIMAMSCQPIPVRDFPCSTYFLSIMVVMKVSNSPHCLRRCWWLMEALECGSLTLMHLQISLYSFFQWLLVMQMSMQSVTHCLWQYVMQHAATNNADLPPLLMRNSLLLEQSDNTCTCTMFCNFTWN